MGVLNINVNQLRSYEFCPARFYLEHKVLTPGRNNQKVRVPFDVKRVLFRELFKLDNKGPKFRLRKAAKVIDHYAKFLGNETLNSRIMIAHLIKTYEKLVHSLNTDDYELPGTITVRMDRGCYLEVLVDMVAFSKKMVTYVILVSSEHWNPIDISNSFDNYIVSRLIVPSMESHTVSDRWQICYYCPDNGKSCILPASQVKSFNLTSIERRIHRVFKQVTNHVYSKVPSGLRCEACPLVEKCNPNMFITSTFNERVDVLEAPICL